MYIFEVLLGIPKGMYARQISFAESDQNRGF